jgi:hypothetical protein
MAAETTGEPEAGTEELPDLGEDPLLATAASDDRGGLGAIGVWLGLLVGTALVVYAYNRAARGVGGDDHFHLLWLGTLAFLAPAAARLLGQRCSRPERLVIVVGIALFDYLPKYLRDPSMPLFHDELAHWHQVEAVVHTGSLFGPNSLITILRDFPGLHGLTAALRELSGASTFTAATVLLMVAHTVALIGVFTLAERLTRSSRIGGVAALVYSLNPSYVFFDTQFSYESLGIVFFIWVLVALVAALDPGTAKRAQRAWLASGVLLAYAGVVTHHLSSYVTVAVLALIAALVAVRSRVGDGNRSEALMAWAYTAVIAAATAAWLVFVASRSVPYIEPHVTGGISELLNVISGGNQPRALFAQSTLPTYERAAAFLAPPLAFMGAIAGLRQLRHRRPAGPLLGLVVFGLLYFPALPFILSQSGSEGARRSWGFTYLGLAILLSPALVGLLTGHGGERARAWRTKVTAIVALLAVVMVGNVAAGLDEQYRFPGPYVFGSDTRSLTPELIAASEWFRVWQGPGQRIVADRYSSLALASFGGEEVAVPSAGFPAWEMLLQPSPSQRLVKELSSSGFRYLVVDQRMAQFLPRVGIYFQSIDEPGALTRKLPIPEANLTRWEWRPWAVKIFQSDHLAVYRLDFGALNDRYPRRRAR